MTKSTHTIARWLPAGTAASRGGLPAIFSICFYLFIVVLILRAGTVARTAREPNHWTIGDLFAICLLAIVLYAASVFFPALVSKGSGTLLGRFSRRFRSNRAAVAGLVILLAALCAAVLAPVITAYDPAAQPSPVGERYMPPSSDHPLGTDKFGRDILSRVL
jgi:hypothetical protein